MATKETNLQRSVREDNESGRKRDARTMTTIVNERERNGIRDRRRTRIQSQRFTIGETSEDRRRRLHGLS